MPSLVIFVLMLVAVLAFGFALVWAIAGNLRRGDEVRRKLARNLETLRLGRALEKFGIDTREYLHSQPIVDIEGQMRNCRACGDLARCDESLEGGTVVDFDFCPNQEPLNALGDAGLAQQVRR